jgi:hypothetical protein
MPYIDLMSVDDYASIWYTTNSRFGNVGSFDPEKPTIVMLHPMFLDSTWLDSQFGDPRLDSGFNLIAFDMRVCGRSTCRPSGLHDSWVEAADLAFIYHVSHPSIRSPSVEPIHILPETAGFTPPSCSYPCFREHINKLCHSIRHAVCELLLFVDCWYSNQS